MHVKVHPRSAALKLTVDNESPDSGTTVTATVTTNPDKIAGIAVPINGDVEWDLPDPGVHCNGGNRVCTFTATQSGTLLVTGIVNGATSSDEVEINVQPKPDSMPHDSTGADSTGPCLAPPQPGPRSAGSGPQASGPALRRAQCGGDSTPKPVIACEPASVTRAQNVMCTVSVEPAAPFRVVGWTSNPSGAPSVMGPAGIDVPSGGQTSWGGVALVTTTIRARVVIDVNGGTSSQQGEGQFVVIPRSWPEFSLPAPPPDDPIVVTAVDPRTMADPPRPGSILGYFAIPPVSLAGSETIRAESGPDQGLVALAIPPALPRAYVYLHPALFGGPWFDDQNGGHSSSSRRCDRADMLRLQNLVRGHEYLNAGDGSHLGIAQSFFKGERLQQWFEALVASSAPDSMLWIEAQRKYDREDRRLSQIQDQFDATDYPRIYFQLGCDLDYNSDPGDG